MSPRPKRYRIVERPPAIKGFRPIGSRHCVGRDVQLLYEEYEALKLADYLHCTHAEAASRMDVSRPTFTRIYDDARKKVALAFVESRPLMIIGGQVQFSEAWFFCKACSNTFAPVDPETFDGIGCPLCGHVRPELYTGDNKSATG